MGSCFGEIVSIVAEKAWWQAAPFWWEYGTGLSYLLIAHKNKKQNEDNPSIDPVFSSVSFL